MQINENTTIRQFLQILGSECLRNNLHPNIHVLATFSDYTPSYQWGKSDEYELPKWILTDCRFPNEAQAIKDRGGIIIRVNRLFDDEMGYTAPQHLHPSETSLDNWNFDWVINNDGTIEDLIIKVKIMLKHFGILTKEMINN